MFVFFFSPWTHKILPAPYSGNGEILITSWCSMADIELISRTVTSLVLWSLFFIALPSAHRESSRLFIGKMKISWSLVGDMWLIIIWYAHARNPWMNESRGWVRPMVDHVSRPMEEFIGEWNSLSMDSLNHSWKFSIVVAALNKMQFQWKIEILGRGADWLAKNHVLI